MILSTFRHIHEMFQLNMRKYQMFYVCQSNIQHALIFQGRILHHKHNRHKVGRCDVCWQYQTLRLLFILLSSKFWNNDCRTKLTHNAITIISWHVQSMTRSDGQVLSHNKAAFVTSLSQATTLTWGHPVRTRYGVFGQIQLLLWI